MKRFQLNFKALSSSLFDNGNIAFSLRWNWGGVLLFVLIWSYGFENVTFSNSPVKSLLVMAFAISAIAIINRVSYEYRNLYQEEIQFTNSDISVLSLYCIFLVILTVFATYELDISLVGDQLYHAQTSQNQSMDIASWLIHKFRIPEIVEYKIVIRFVSCLILAIVIFLITYIRQYRLNDRTVLMVLIFILLKFGHHYVDVHPPFRLLPLWISSVLFGINDFSFRFVSLIALSIFAYAIYRFSQKYFDRFVSFLIGLAVCTIPLLLHVGSIVEQSIWTALSWSFILISIRESSQNPNYIRWISVIVITSLMRAPAFVALVPIFLMMGVEYLKTKDNKSIRKYLIYATPVLVLIPFLWIQLTQGTSATSGQLAPSHQVISSLANGFSIKAMYYNIQMPWVLFLLFCLIPINRNWLSSAIYAVFFVSAYFVFYSIQPVLWGVPRYQAELWMPFVILGYYNVVTMPGWLKYNKIYLSFGLAILILFNTIVTTHLNSINRPVDEWKDYYEEVKNGNVKIWSEGVYNISDALQTVKKAGLSRNTCIVGITYGTFSEVMNGYSIGEMENARANFPVCSSWGPLNISEISSNKNIKRILFVDKPNKENEINQLLDSGQWLMWNKFYNEKYGSTIVGIVRN